MKITRKAVSAITLAALILLLLPFNAFATDYTGPTTGIILRDPALVEGGLSTSDSFQLISATDYPGAGTSTSTSFEDRYGYVYYNNEPLITQTAYRWYTNTDSATPTTAIAAENTSFSEMAVTGRARLRIALETASQAIPAANTFTLQYAGKGAYASCSAIPTGNFSNISTIGSSGQWTGYDNTSVTTGTALASNLISGASTLGTYEESPTSAALASSIPIGSSADLEYDWSLQYNGTENGGTYCFRMVRNGGTLLSTGMKFATYSEFPTVTVHQYVSSGISMPSTTVPATETTTKKTAAETVATETVATETVATETVAEIPVDPGDILFTGYTFPNATVHILRDGTELSNTIANAKGYFQTTIQGTEEGTFNFALYAKDTDESLTSTYTTAVNVVGEAENRVENMLIPPTIQTSKISIVRGDSMLIYGKGAPNLDVTIALISGAGERAYIKKKSDSKGNYFYFLDTSTLPNGTYELKAQSFNSLFSKVMTITVGATTVFTNASQDLSADLNADGLINLIDFSILSYWYNKAFPQGDLNNDGTINLTDFSILTYSWTG